ncbi:MAG: ferritin-like domain-containing protein [Vicinamibacterales bacterium]
MRQDDLQQILTECAAERVALLERHEAGARVVSHYDFNNAYQYVISREETHLQWLQTALAEFGATIPAPSARLAVPEVAASPRKGDVGAFRAVYEDDARQLAAFVARWRERVDAMTHARHRKMLDVILGESREHQHLFEQAAAGVEDLLGRRTGGVRRQGSVLSVRWLE